VLFAKEGAKVVCADINETGASKTAAKIEQLIGQGAAIAVKTDVSNEEQVKALVDKAVETYGKLSQDKKNNKQFNFFFLKQVNLILCLTMQVSCILKMTMPSIPRKESGKF
jgi:NAD(P)-dependent dehydrogenase (short-subunit alcohol dehydrogenase family)